MNSAAAANPGVNVAAGTTLGELCPFACARAHSIGSCAAPPSVNMTRDIVYLGWPLDGVCPSVTLPSLHRRVS
jgi:hypothetical protein